MSTWFRNSLIVTAILVGVSVAGRIWLEWLWQARDGGAFVVFYFWIFITLLATIPSTLITLGMWIARKMRKPPDSQSFHL